ncbi:MAG: histidine kinase [Chitinophagaceae bacterium]|nr:MAG: histidine kinase [Chitinophagaceae bacterium]
MKQPFDRKTLRFYVLVALASLLLSVIHDLVTNPATFTQRFVNDTWRTIYVVALHFFLFEYAIPFIRLKRKTIISNIFIGLGFLFLLLMLYSWGLSGWRLFGIGLNIYTPFETKGLTDSIVTQQMSFSMGSVFFFGVIRHFYNYYKLKQATQQLQIQKQQAELNYLKSQTNPHFLFNTLNNIYALARDKSDLAPESILRLSKILRYMLYETGGDYIAIEQELKIIIDYIALEQLRYDDSLRINLNNDIEDMKQSIPPLLLIPLVENAFKHGVSETRGLPYINIHLSVKSRKLLFLVKNSSEAPNSTASVTEHIGLTNLRRQLQLLYTDYDLTVQQENSAFTASLTINLGSLKKL